MDKNAQWALVAAAWFLALSVALLGWLGYRHLNRPVAVAAEPAGGGIVPLGDRAICPVTHQSLVVDAKSSQAVSRGRTYYFAPGRDERGREYRTLFLMDPEAYLSGQPSLRPTVAPSPGPSPVSSPAPMASPTELSPAAAP